MRQGLASLHGWLAATPRFSFWDVFHPWVLAYLILYYLQGGYSQFVGSTSFAHTQSQITALSWIIMRVYIVLRPLHCAPLAAPIKVSQALPDSPQVMHSPHGTLAAISPLALQEAAVEAVAGCSTTCEACYGCARDPRSTPLNARCLSFEVSVE